MSDRHTPRRENLSAPDRQMLAAGYWPVIVFAAVLIIARIAGMRRYRNEGGAR
jgi:hypothetical protein